MRRDENNNEEDIVNRFYRYQQISIESNERIILKALNSIVDEVEDENAKRSIKDILKKQKETYFFPIDQLEIFIRMLRQKEFNNIRISFAKEVLPEEITVQNVQENLEGWFAVNFSEQAKLWHAFDKLWKEEKDDSKIITTLEQYTERNNQCFNEYTEKIKILHSLSSIDSVKNIIKRKSIILDKEIKKLEKIRDAQEKAFEAKEDYEEKLGSLVKIPFFKVDDFLNLETKEEEEFESVASPALLTLKPIGFEKQNSQIILAIQAGLKQYQKKHPLIVQERLKYANDEEYYCSKYKSYHAWNLLLKRMRKYEFQHCDYSADLKNLFYYHGKKENSAKTLILRAILSQIESVAALPETYNEKIASDFLASYYKNTETVLTEDQKKFKCNLENLLFLKKEQEALYLKIESVESKIQKKTTAIHNTLKGYDGDEKSVKKKKSPKKPVKIQEASDYSNHEARIKLNKPEFKGQLLTEAAEEHLRSPITEEIKGIRLNRKIEKHNQLIDEIKENKQKLLGLVPQKTIEEALRKIAFYKGRLELETQGIDSYSSIYAQLTELSSFFNHQQTELHQCYENYKNLPQVLQSVEELTEKLVVWKDTILKQRVKTIQHELENRTRYAGEMIEAIDSAIAYRSIWRNDIAQSALKTLRNDLEARSRQYDTWQHELINKKNSVKEVRSLLHEIEKQEKDFVESCRSDRNALRENTSSGRVIWEVVWKGFKTILSLGSIWCFRDNTSRRTKAEKALSQVQARVGTLFQISPPPKEESQVIDSGLYFH